MITKEDIELAKVNNEYLGELIVQNERLIQSASKKYLKKWNYEDVLQEARYAFIKAVHNYDLDHSYKPSNYIYTVIMRHVSNWHKGNTGVIQIPYACFVAHDMYENGLEIPEIADKLNKKESIVKQYLQTSLSPVSYDFSKPDRENESNYSLIDFKVINRMKFNHVEDEVVSNDLIDRVKDVCSRRMKPEHADIFIHSAMTMNRPIESYREFYGDSDDGQGRPAGYVYFNRRVNEIKKELIKTGELNWL